MELTPGFKARMLVNIIFLFIYAIILPIQAYFFYRFTSESNKGLRYENAEELNSSFKWLFRHAVFAAILFVLNSLWAMYLAQQEIRRLIHSA